MATLFRIPRTKVDPKTGKRVTVTDAKGNTVYTAHWHARIEDHKGHRRNFTLSPNKSQAQKEADMIENREREIRLGLRPPPSTLELSATRPVGEVMDEYFAWGEAQGGRKGRPWAKSHSRNKRTILSWWFKVLSATHLGDVANCLAKVEEELRVVAAKGRPDKRKSKAQKPLTGKTRLPAN